MNTTTKTVLVFSKVAGPETAAKLHAASCSVVAKARGSVKFSVVEDQGDDEVAYEIADLGERGFRVTKCACVK